MRPSDQLSERFFQDTTTFYLARKVFASQLLILLIREEAPNTGIACFCKSGSILINVYNVTVDCLNFSSITFEVTVYVRPFDRPFYLHDI